MKNLYKLFALMFIITFTFSCKDDELPLPVADFTTDPKVPEVGLPTMFENLTVNAATYSWDFGDGSDPVVEISPSHTYAEAGTFTVTLTATTQDGQSVTSVKEIDISERLLTGININLFSFQNGVEDWDPAETNPDSVYADVMILIGNAEGSIRLGPTPEISETPIGADLSSAGLVLTNEDWFIGLYDYDGPKEDIDNPDFTNFETVFQTIIEAGFNPITDYPTIKNEDEDAGYFSIVGSDAAGNYIDVDIFFELQ